MYEAGTMMHRKFFLDLLIQFFEVDCFVFFFELLLYYINVSGTLISVDKWKVIVDFDEMTA